MRRSLAVLFVLGAVSARADQFNLYGNGPRAAAMSGALTAEANDYTAAYYNPALLVHSKDVNFGFQFQWYRMAAEVVTKDQAKTLQCSDCQAPDAVGTSIGLLLPLGGKVKNRVAIGLDIYLPATRMVRVWSPDSYHPYWYRYNSNPERLVLHAGLGVRITDWLTVGAGIQALADLGGQGAIVQVDLFSKQVLATELDAGLSTRVAPVVGIHLQPIKRLKLGVTYRGEMKLAYEIPASVDMKGIGILAFKVAGVAHYTPHMVSFGASFDATKDFTIALDGEWMNWSAAPSPYSSLLIAVSGPTLDGLGLGNALTVNSLDQKPGFSDTFGARLGAEYRVSDRFAVRAGVSYRPTPVPRQDVANTNLLDADTLGATVGIGFNFPDPLEIFQSPIQIDVAAQGHFLMPRDTNKDATDVIPSYTYQARVLGLTAAVRYDF